METKYDFDMNLLKLLCTDQQRFETLMRKSPNSTGYKCKKMIESFFICDIGFEFGYPSYTLGLFNARNTSAQNTDSKIEDHCYDIIFDSLSNKIGRRPFVKEVLRKTKIIPSKFILKLVENKLKSDDDRFSYGLRETYIRDNESRHILKDISKMFLLRAGAFLHHFEDEVQGKEFEQKMRFSFTTITAFRFFNQYLEASKRVIDISKKVQKTEALAYSISNCIHIRTDLPFTYGDFYKQPYLKKYRRLHDIVLFLYELSPYLCEINFYTGDSVCENGRRNPGDSYHTEPTTAFIQRSNIRLGDDYYKLATNAQTHYCEKEQVKIDLLLQRHSEHLDSLTKAHAIEYRMQKTILDYKYIMYRVALYTFIVHCMKQEKYDAELVKEFWYRLTQ